MKKTCTLLFIIVLLFFTGCEDKKTQEIPLETATSEESIIEILDKKDKKIQKTTIENNTTNTVISVTTAPLPLLGDAFILHDTDQNERTVAMNKKNISISDTPQSMVLINFFTTWCPSCMEEIPYLSDLQKKYKTKLSVIGVLIQDTQSNNDLKMLLNPYEAEYFISNSKENDVFSKRLLTELKIRENFSIPLTVLYKNGSYYKHYEGPVPIEMIEYDIKQAIK